VNSRRALLAALGVDNFGSGLFLPLALVYATRVVGLSLAAAGTLVAAGTLAGLASPVIAGRMVDRFGPRPVVVSAQLIQAAGAVVYLLARSGPVVLTAAAVLAIGQQAFYSSLFALIADVAGSGPRDRPYMVASMVRSACFGLGGLVAAGLLTAAGQAALRAAVAADAASFLACAVMLALFVRVPAGHPRARVSRAREPARHRVLSDRPFLGLIAVCGLATLAGDLFLTGMPVYALEILHTRPWLPGTLMGLDTALLSVAGTAALRVTRRLSRPGAMQLGAALYICWCGASLAAFWIPPGWRAAELLAATVILAAATLAFFSRANALAEAAAPDEARGRFLAAFQYAFTIGGIITPAIVALFSAGVWLPWVLVAAASGAAAAGLGALSRRLPARALAPQDRVPGSAPRKARRAAARKQAARGAAPEAPGS
jgi:MFS family permease